MEAFFRSSSRATIFRETEKEQCLGRKRDIWKWDISKTKEEKCLGPKSDICSLGKFAHFATLFGNAPVLR